METRLEFRSVGKPVRRNEDERLITGKGRFTDDFSLPGQVWAAMVRSPHPHATIEGVDASAALVSDGVLGVYTGADLAADGLGQIPHNPVPSTQFDIKLTGRDGTPVYIGEHYLLPRDRVRHVGEAVAMVVAETRQQALTAAEMVMVDYEPLPWVSDTAAATEPDAPRLWDALPDNVLVDSWYGDRENTDAAFARAAHVVSMRYHLHRVTGVPLEPRAALGAYDPETGRYTLYAGSGGAVRQKNEHAKVLGVAPEQVRVLSLDVGGNFGTRNRAFVEFGLVMYASKKLGRPVKFRADRSEAFLTDYQGRDLVVEIELAIDETGKFLALRTDNLSNIGSRCVSLSPLSKGSGLITGSYDIPYAMLHSRAVFSNTMSTQAYRSSGRPEVTFAIERLIDKAARELGYDRLELRRRNLVRPEQMPYTNAVGSQYDSGEYEKNMDRVLELADFAGTAARKAEARARGKLYGIGFSNYVEVLDRHAEGTGRPDRAAGRGRGGDRHSARRPGPRDQLRPGHRRPAGRAVRDREDHAGRHRRGDGWRRHPLRTFHAPRQRGDLSRERRPRGKGQAPRGRAARGRPRRRGLQRRALPHRQQDRGLVRARPFRQRPRRDAQRTPGQRDAHPGIPERGLRLRDRNRPGDRRAWRSSATPRSTTSGAASIR